MKISDIRLAKYNPRKMSKDARTALMASIKAFDDISGIVVNETTGNVLAGNHRWDQLFKIHGKKNIKLAHLAGEHYSINAKDKPTGFLVRIVQWDESKERAANVTANNDLIQGEFTQGLQDVLNALSESTFPDDMFESLRLDELQIDLDGIDELDWSEDTLNTIQDEAEEANNMLDDPKGEKNGEVKEIRTELKISIPTDLKDEIKDDVLEFLAGKHYYGLITVT